MLEIRTAKEEEFENVVSFYDAVIDGMQNAKSKPGWKKGIYPDEKFLNGAIERQELLIGILDGVITCLLYTSNTEVLISGIQSAIWIW